MEITDNRLPRLVRLNIIVAVVVGITVIAGAAYDSVVVILARGVASLVFFPGLAIGNIIAIFRLWKAHRKWSVVPFASYVACTVVLFAVVRLGTSLVLRGTPMSPHTFPRGEVKVDLEHTAADLLGHSFKTIWTRPGAALPVSMVAGSPAQPISAALLHRLRTYGFDAVFVDDAQSLVVFSAYHSRTWYNYLYAGNQVFAPAYSRQSAITSVDIGNWEELPRIARQGPTGDGNQCISFRPTVVYPILRQTFGEDQLNAISTSDGSTLTPVQKAMVLKALNDQRAVSSRLVEDPCITMTKTERFHLSVGQPISDSFWVSKLVQTLLRSGTLQLAEDRSHLRIKKNLTELEQHQVEWVHVGLMNFLWGNLLEKRDLSYSEDLGGGWYFGFY